jgi:hypothetical protein
VTLKFEGYLKSPDGFGTGTYEILHPKGASIEITRSLFEGDVLQITSVRNTPDPTLEKKKKLVGSGSMMIIRSCSMGICARLITGVAATSTGR